MSCVQFSGNTFDNTGFNDNSIFGNSGNLLSGNAFPQTGNLLPCCSTDQEIFLSSCSTVMHVLPLTCLQSFCTCEGCKLDCMLSFAKQH